MVEEMYPQGLRGGLDALCEVVVHRAGSGIITGMIMHQGYHCGVAEECFLHDDAHIYGCFADAAMAYSHRLEEAVGLVYQQYPCFLSI